MFLNTPDYPRCLDRDCMIVMTLSCIFPASLGTIFAGGGYADVHYKLKFPITNKACQAAPFTLSPRTPFRGLLSSYNTDAGTESGMTVPLALSPRIYSGASIHRTYRRYGTSRRYVPFTFIQKNNP